MIGLAQTATFRRYRTANYDSVAALWTRINRELAPAGIEELFDRYIAMTMSARRDYMVGFNKAGPSLPCHLGRRE
jgi:hypothetical protein